MTATDQQSARSTVRAACPHDCPDTCAMLVTVADGRALEVRGDPAHPFTRGGLCVKVNNYVDKVYSPDRLLHPMRRSGPKGSGRFERISWDEALDEIAARFRETIATSGAEAIMPVSYLGTEGILNGLNVGDPFFNKLGATISERTYCDSGSCTAYTMTMGATAGVDPESLVHSRYIVIWACNMISTNLHLWPFVLEAQRRGAKVVVIDPLRHRTAKAADWHLPIRPGTDGALALAGVLLGGRVFPRYFLQLLPVVVLAGARGIAVLIDQRRKVMLVVIAVTALVPLFRFGPRYILLALHRDPNWRDTSLDRDSGRVQTAPSGA